LLHEEEMLFRQSLLGHFVVVGRRLLVVVFWERGWATLSVVRTW
jgi:hypothetical protein